MDLLHILAAYLAVIIYLIGFVPYIYHVYHGRVIPHPYSWTVWAILSMISTIWLISTLGLDTSSISPIIRTICLCIWGCIWWYFIQKIKINIFDYICLSLGIAIIYIAFHFSLAQAIISMICVDLLILTPTLKKIWNDPRSEDSLAWITTALSQIFLLLSLEKYTFDIVVFWVYIMLVNASVAAYILLRVHYLDRWRVRIWRFFSAIVSRGKT